MSRGYCLPTYPSPKPLLTITSHLSKMLAQGRGRWEVAQKRTMIRQFCVQVISHLTHTQNAPVEIARPGRARDGDICDRFYSYPIGLQQQRASKPIHLTKHSDFKNRTLVFDKNYNSLKGALSSKIYSQSKNYSVQNVT